MKFDVELYATWRRDQPTRSLPREVEEHMVLEIVRLRDEVQAERAAVVAWLREWATPQSDWYDLSVRSSVLLEASDHIERGEHRREEER